MEPGATVHTDGWQAYWTVPEHGYTPERTVMRKHHDPAPVVMPGGQRVASLLERWLLGTHQGGVSSEHLDAYPKRVHVPFQPPALAASRNAPLAPA